MPCYHPLSAYQDGRRRVFFNLNGCDVYKSIKLPCGQCIGCRLEKSRQWAVRCVHESHMHSDSCFVTLTYDDVHLSRDRSLNYRDFQLFMKRLRKHFLYSNKVSGSDSRTALSSGRVPEKCIRFYMCGEYGEQFSRPHFHACLFGVFFPDRVVFKRLASGSVLYTSKLLESLWPYGFSSIGDVTFESAAYVARYVLKKITGDAADEHYKSFDSETGEVFWRVPEFTRMSLKPGIGATWFDKYKDEVLCRDAVVIRGKECRVPRYYDKLLESVTPEIVDWTRIEREADAMRFEMEQTAERLGVRERVAQARLSFRKRVLK